MNTLPYQLFGIIFPNLTFSDILNYRLVDKREVIITEKILHLFWVKLSECITVDQKDHVEAGLLHNPNLGLFQRAVAKLRRVSPVCKDARSVAEQIRQSYNRSSN